jgi:hypothetical protein
VSAALRLLPLAALLAACNGLSPGDSVVQHVETREGVAGVSVVLDCQTGRGIESIQSLRKVVKVTDAQGRYRFDRGDLSGCSFGSLDASKEGYANLSGPQLVNHSAAGLGFGFIEAPKAAMWRLQAAASAATSFAGKDPATGWTPLRKYTEVFELFVRAREMAQPGEETRFVIGHYCPLLDRLHEGLSQADRSKLSAHPAPFSGKQFVKVAHGDVTQWCAAAEAAG